LALVVLSAAMQLWTRFGLCWPAGVSEVAARVGLHRHKPARTAAPSTGRCHPEAEDAELRAALDETLAMAEQFVPTVILLTAGVAFAHSSVSLGGPPPTK